LKREIEHLQHLLEHARHRLTRDFEHWYVNVYLDDSASREEEKGGGGENFMTSTGEKDEALVPTMPNLGAQAKINAIKV
jgi:hypothetical protein